MANPEHVAILQQGVTRWNEWRKDKDGRSLDLSEADLRNRDLTGIDLRAANLSKAVLRGAKLGTGSLLWNANLSGADLYGANLRSADLQDVNFSGADLFQADLRESNLQGADLSTAKGGLLSRQLAGSDLTGAKLPDSLAKLYDGLSSVKEISDSAQKLFLALLAGCLYSWLTIAQTTDVELITNRATTPLPIIQAAIPIVGFYVVAPLILLCLYFYFHFYLQKLWEELGSLPAVFTDGRELHKRTDPWLLNDLVRSHFAKLKDGRPFLSYFQAWVSVVLAWWLVPTTLFLFWGRFLRRHDLIWTIFHALLLVLAMVSAVRLYRVGGETLRGRERKVFCWQHVVKRRSTYLRLAFAMAFSALLIAISLGAILGEPHWEPHKSRMQLQIHSPRTWVLWLLDRAGYHPFANFNDADVSVKPATWTGKNDQELDLVKGANLTGRDLRNAYADHAFFAKANLAGTYMQHAHFESADLRQAHLNGARMEGAILSGASLQEATMNGGDLEYADLGLAELTRATLHSVDFSHANLEFADLSGADLRFGAKLRWTDLGGATLQRAILRVADLENADLSEADLLRASLRAANLTNIKLNGATIKYADFRSFDSKLTRGLTSAMITAAADWKLAFFDPDMLKQLGLPPDHNEKLQKQMETEQQAKAAPATPPAPKAKP